MNGDSIKSREYFRRGLLVAEDKESAYFNWQSVEFEEGNYLFSKRLCDTLINVFSHSNATYYYERGEASVHLCDIEGALADFEKALSLAPFFSDAYDTMLGLGIYVNEWDHLKRLIDYTNNMAARTNPDSAVHLVRIRSFLRAKAGDFLESYKDLELALQKNPKDPINYILKGIIESALHTDDKIVFSEYETARSLAPETWRPYMALAYYYREHQKLKIAKENLDRAITYGATPDSGVSSYLKGGPQPAAYQTLLSYVVGGAVLSSKGDVTIKCK